MKSLFLFLVLLCSTSYGQICFVRVERTSPPDKKGDGTIATGFFVANDTILTCYHVISKCLVKYKNKVRIDYKNRIYLVEIVDHSKLYDLALLKTIEEVLDEDIAVFADRGPKKDEIITCRGHSQGRWSIYASRGKFDREIIDDGMRKYRIKAMVMGGMSGGPMENEAGEVVAVIVERSTDHLPDRTFGSTLSQIKEFLK